MNKPQTLLSMAGARPSPASLKRAALLVIDAQREYVDGRLPLGGIGTALQEVAAVIERAREAGTPIFHIAHDGGAPGKLFDRSAQSGQFAPEATPRGGETVIVKTLPNAFAGTDLERRLHETARGELIVVGFMTHMCVSSTVRAALDLGYAATVIAAATATRALPATSGGGIIPPTELQRASLAALADRFAVIAANGAALAP